MSNHFDLEQEQRVRYAFGHLASSKSYPEEAHAGDSADLAHDVFDELGLDEREKELMEIVAEMAAFVRQESHV